METVHDVLERAWQAHAAGQFEDALRDYLWLYDEAPATHPEAGPLRLSYVLSGWAKLAEEYVPARRALLAARDRDAHLLLDGRHDEQLFHNVQAINEKTGDLVITHELFRHLSQAAPALAQQCARRALPAVIACGGHQLGRQYMPDPLAYLASQAVLLNAAALDERLTPEDLLSAIYNYAEEAKLVLDLLEAAGDTAGYAQAWQRTLELVESDELRAWVQNELENPGATLDAIIAREQGAVAD
ncbi:hypothetical protein ACLB1G_22895 [Oxalobacteraceae bacterium A2-2]